MKYKAVYDVLNMTKQALKRTHYFATFLSVPL